MDRIGVVGLNWRDGGPERLASYTLAPEGREARLPELARALGASELVYLATCNRVELAFVVDDPASIRDSRRTLFRQLVGRDPEPGEAERELRAWQGEGAVEHLFLVAAGLDSARLGETEISGQVRDALEAARARDLSGPRLELLFREARKLGRRARGSTALGEGRTSLAEIGLDVTREALARESGTVALVGVSPMTERCARSLCDEGVELLVINRTLERAEELVGQLGSAARAVELEVFRARPTAVRAVLSATGAPGVVLGAEELGRLASAATGELPALVDFATEPDLDPAAARELGFLRVGMDEILATAEATRAGRLLEVGEARSLVDEAVESFSQRLAERAVEQALRSLHESYQATARDQVERLLRAKLRELGGEGQDSLRRFVDRLARHFAHVPASGLREVAREFGVDAVHRFFARAEEDLRRGVEHDLLDGRHFAPVTETHEGERAG